MIGEAQTFEIPQVERIVERVVEVVCPEKIICFGLRKYGGQSWSCFLPDDNSGWNVCCDLLVIIGDEETRMRHDLIDLIEACQASAGISGAVLVHTLSDVNHALATGGLFFHNVCSSGIVLFDRWKKPFVSYDSSRRFESHLRMKELATQSFQLAQQFREGALHYMNTGDLNMCVFMLHQALEHNCIALIRSSVGYSFQTHNIKRLLRLTANFCNWPAEIFPCNTSLEKDILKTLARAYSDVRYKQGYSVTSWQVNILIERINRFQEQCRAAFAAKVKLQDRFLSTS